MTTHTATRPETESPGKQRIREAARQAIVEHGFDLAASRAITSAAGVSSALLFYHYGSLEECLVDAVDSSVHNVFTRLYDALGGVDDPVLRARILLEWHVPSSPTQRQEWLLSFEFVRASFRLPSITPTVRAQYDKWQAAIVGEYLLIRPEMGSKAAVLTAKRLIGLSDGLGLHLILRDPSMREADVRTAISATMSEDLGIPPEKLVGAASAIKTRLAVLRGSESGHGAESTAAGELCQTALDGVAR